MIFGNNAFRLVPTVEQPPVVRTNDKMESVLGISPFQRIQRMNSIRRPRQMEFKIGSAKLGITSVASCTSFKRNLSSIRSFSSFSGLWGDHKPHFVQVPVFAKIVGEGQMSDVYRVERAAEDSYIHLFLFIYNLTMDVFATHARQPKH